MKKTIITICFAVALGFVAWHYVFTGQQTQFVLKSVKLARSDVVQRIRASGTIEPEQIVDVGAQVAGQIKELSPDPDRPEKSIGYGSSVRKGAILARIDDSIFRAKVDQARARLAQREGRNKELKARAAQAEREFRRTKRLVGVVTVTEQERILLNRDVAQAELTISQAQLAEAASLLDEAEANLRYTVIRSPIDGVIIDLRINVGQTMVANLNTPSLFLIAEDLKRMEIWASVNEADIGSIQPGQTVTFTVSAFPEQIRHGVVKTIRLNARVSQNVVTYTVVIGIDNDDERLLPYMTADVAFEAARRENALTVPNSALHWRPKREMIAPKSRSTHSAYANQSAASGVAQSDRSAGGVIWVRDNPWVRPVKVVTGFTDGVVTELIRGGVDEKDEVVIGQSRTASGDEKRTPFLPRFKRRTSK